VSEKAGENASRIFRGLAAGPISRWRGLYFQGLVLAGMGWLLAQLKGNKYDYRIEAKFTDMTGTGSGDEGAGFRGALRFSFIEGD
jgi:hypothetical protein